MTHQASVPDLLESIYTSFQNDNEGLDELIQQLKSALAAGGQASVVMQPERLVRNNREGRKMLQAYFRKRGVTVTFPA